MSSRHSFELLLTDSILFEQFKEFAVKDFSVENALFYDRCTKLKRRPPRTEKLLAREQQDIYDRFLSEGAELQVNLSDQTSRTIRELVERGEFGRGLYDAAIDEVAFLMYTNTFPRFLRDIVGPEETETTRKEKRRGVFGKRKEEDETVQVVVIVEGDDFAVETEGEGAGQESIEDNAVGESAEARNV